MQFVIALLTIQIELDHETGSDISKNPLLKIKNRKIFKRTSTSLLWSWIITVSSTIL